MKHFLSWLADRISASRDRNDRPLRPNGAHSRPTRSAIKPGALKPKARNSHAPAELVSLNPHLGAEIEDNGPGKNVLIRNKYVREDTGTHDTLKILDDSSIVSDDETGIDPYNTGQFDRSKNWDKRFRN